MRDIDVTFCGLDSLVIRCNGYDDVIDLLKLLNDGGYISLSSVLESLDLRKNIFDDMLSLSSDEYFILMPLEADEFKVIAFNDVSDNKGFSYKFVLPEFKSFIFGDIKMKEMK